MQNSNIISCMRTDKGLVRLNNEDSLFVTSDNNNPNGYDLEKMGRIFSVADGMGGHKAGEVASKVACKVISQFYGSKNVLPSEPIKSLQQMFDVVNNEILRLSLTNQQYFGMGTTLSSLFVYEDRAYIAHIGDSRIYRFRDEKMALLTRDHTELQLLIEMGIVTPENAINHPIRNILTQAVGIESKLDVYTWQGQIKKDDIYLLCSDGLYDMISDATIEKIISDNRLSPFSICEKLIHEALNNGGKDNVSVVVVKC